MQASCLVSLGLLVQPAVQASFDAMDLLYRGQTLAIGMLPRFIIYAVLHAGSALVVGATVIAIGIKSSSASPATSTSSRRSAKATSLPLSRSAQWWW